MGADADLLNLLSSNIRLCMGNIMAQGITLAVLTALRKQKRPLLPFAVYMWTKSILMMVLIDLRIWYGNTETLLLLNGVAGVCTPFFSVWITMYTYEGDFITILFSMVAAELIGEAVLQISVLMTNLLEGRPELLTFRAAFQWADIQMLLWGALTFAVIWILLIPALKGFRRYEVRRKKAVNVMKTVWIIYILTSPLTGLTDFRSGALFFISKYVITLSAIAASVISVYLIVSKYQRDICRQRDFLMLQKEQMEQYYQGMQGQILEMEQNQQSMNCRMEEIMRRDIPSYGERQKWEEYLKELRDEYDRLRGGMYCNDRMTDAVLCCQKEAAEARGIEVEYSMSGYSAEIAGAGEMARILFYLLDYGIRENERQGRDGQKLIRLHAGTVKNHLILELYIGCLPDAAFSQKPFREFIEKYNGTVTDIRDETGRRIVISLQNPQ